MTNWQPLDTIPKCGRRIRVKGYCDTQTKKIVYLNARHNEVYNSFVADSGWIVFPIVWKEILK